MRIQLNKSIRYEGFNISIEERAVNLAHYIIDSKDTVRGAAKRFGVSKSTAHAEIMAIRDACKKLQTYNLEGCMLYTSCYPCPMCISAIIWSNIKEVYYGNTQKDADEIGFRDDKIYEFIEKMSTSQNTNLIKLTELDRNETIKTFEEFKNKQDKTIY